ncbi:hypothetical protein C0Q70_01458 [Pomacea canaliculata]|uniref:EF-hand domain-containing protein n=1 Tax=Pomacea canaliculata TaxID=400727 RepID=A0A2T7PZI4_POMCA|nr:hypothetical protein C0Q70_01458 [Pomacea canaliculata]
MSQVGVSRPVSHQLKLGVALPEIKHPLSRMSNPENMDVRGVSRSGDRPASNPPAPSGRPLANEVGSPLRKSVSATGRESRLRRDGVATAASVVIDNIPEGVEVKYGDPGTTRLPVFGSRAGITDRDNQQVASRASSRLSRASTQARLEIDELEALLKEKLKSSYYEVRKRFKDNDPRAAVMEAFVRILVTILGRQISQTQSVKLMERLGFHERAVISFTDFFAYFREAPESSYPRWMDPVQRHNQDRILMTSGQVHAILREKARQRFLDLADMFPQMNPGGSGRIMKSEFHQMLQRSRFYMDDAEFERLWARY